jgi:hypothetical protein
VIYSNVVLGSDSGQDINYLPKIFEAFISTGTLKTLLLSPLPIDLYSNVASLTKIQTNILRSSILPKIILLLLECLDLVSALGRGFGALIRVELHSRQDKNCVKSKQEVITIVREM